MKVLINERLSQHKYKTPEGYLICQDAILARTGKQTYTRGDVFGQDTRDADSDIEIDRKYEEVFSPKTLASFENKPVTVEHPDEDVNVDNYKEYAVGFVRDVKQGKTEDGEDVILGTLVITDAQTIKEIENGEHTELSCGYDCDIVDEENPQQRNIRGNHVALCEHGRAGIAKIVDSWKGRDAMTYKGYKLEEAKYLHNEEIGAKIAITKNGIIVGGADSYEEAKSKIDNMKTEKDLHYGDSMDDAIEKNYKIYVKNNFGAYKVCDWPAVSKDAAIKEFLESNPAYKNKGIIEARDSIDDSIKDGYGTSAAYELLLEKLERFKNDKEALEYELQDIKRTKALPEDEKKDLINKYSDRICRLSDSIHDDDKLELSRLLGSLSKMYSNDPDIKYVINTIKSAGFKQVDIAKIKGWDENKHVKGEYVKEYYLNVGVKNGNTDGQYFKVLCMLYADSPDWKVKEINAYITQTSKYPFGDSVKDSYSPSEIIDILRRQSVGMDENLEIGEERNGWFAQIQNVGKATYENVAKYPNVSPKLSSWAWGRIWKDGKIKFNEKATLNELKQKMIRFLSIQTNDSIKDEDKYIVWADGTKQGNRALYRTATGNAQYCYSADAHQFSKDEAIKLTNQKGGKYTWVMKKVQDSVKDETKAEMIKKAQTWVDYDMKKYGKVSQDTKDDIKALGLKIVDLGGEFEVRDSLKKYEIHYEDGKNIHINIVRAGSLKDALTKVKDDIPDRDIVLKMGEALNRTTWNTKKVLNKQTNKPARLDYFNEDNLVGYEDETNNKVLLIKFKGKFMKKDEFLNVINTKIK